MNEDDVLAAVRRLAPAVLTTVGNLDGAFRVLEASVRPCATGPSSLFVETARVMIAERAARWPAHNDLGVDGVATSLQ